MISSCLQLLKLAAVQAIPDLSDLFVIWDMDMIPARHIPLVYLPSSHISLAGTGESPQVPADLKIMSASGQPVRTVVNIGGAWSPGYGQSYEKLFQKPCDTPPPLRPLVTVTSTKARSHYCHLHQRVECADMPGGWCCWNME
jgi:hypothetical protein